MKHLGVALIEETIFQKYLDFIFNNLGSIYSPMEWLEVDLALSKTEIIILLLLDRDDHLKVSDISRQLNMPLSTTTSIIDRLERKQLVERTRSMEDRRVVIVRLTEKGKGLCRDIFIKLEMTIKNILAKVTQNLSSEEIDFLKKIIAKIT